MTDAERIPDGRMKQTAAIVATPDLLAGSPRFDGTRLDLRAVLTVYLLEGYAPSQVEAFYPGLPDGWRELIDAMRPYLRRRFRKRPVAFEHDHFARIADEFADIDRVAHILHDMKGGGPFGIEGSCECLADAETLAAALAKPDAASQ